MWFNRTFHFSQISNQTGEKVTYLQIRERAIKFALALTKLGIKKGDVVSISSENRFEFTVTAIAVILIGAINAPLNVLYSRGEYNITRSNKNLDMS